MSTAKELRAKSAADLQKELLELRREQFNLRMARATGQEYGCDTVAADAKQRLTAALAALDTLDAGEGAN